MHKKFFSKSRGIYLLLLLPAVTLFLLSFCEKLHGCHLDDVGIGIFCSAIVVLGVDLSDTKRTREKNKILFDMITSDLKEECLELPSEMYTAVYESYGYGDFGKLTFAQWTQKLFDGSETDAVQQEIASVVHQICKIRQAASQVTKLSRFLYDDDCFDMGFVENLVLLTKECARIEGLIRRGKYSESSNAIINKLVPIILALHLGVDNDFNRAYNEDDYV